MPDVDGLMGAMTEAGGCLMLMGAMAPQPS